LDHEAYYEGMIKQLRTVKFHSLFFILLSCTISLFHYLTISLFDYPFTISPSCRLSNELQLLNKGPSILELRSLTNQSIQVREEQNDLIFRTRNSKDVSGNYNPDYTLIFKSRKDMEVCGKLESGSHMTTYQLLQFK
jgi:hypothetical protein